MYWKPCHSLFGDIYQLLPFGVTWLDISTLHKQVSRQGAPTGSARYIYIYPDTPCMPYICQSVGVVLGVNVGIYGSPMECLGMYIYIYTSATWSFCFSAQRRLDGFPVRLTRRLRGARSERARSELRAGECDGHEACQMSSNPFASSGCIDCPQIFMEVEQHHLFFVEEHGHARGHCPLP